MKLHGIHHITAIATDPQRNVDFYTGVLGLRLVKRTVNFDDPGTYHFYFGDRIGAPGTILTFFPWPNAGRGRIGPGQVVATAYDIPSDAWDYWISRLRENHIEADVTGRRFGRKTIRFNDPDGLALELMESDSSDDADPWPESLVPALFALRRFHSPTLASKDRAATAQLLTSLFGFEHMGDENGRARFSLGPDSTDLQVDMVELRDQPIGHVAAGTVHHIAFRAKDETEQEAWRSRLYEIGLQVTPIIDRQYFHSIYFREPGGILFEIATESPGFASDEAPEHLGESLRLPAQFEGSRREIEATLPKITVPGQR